MTRQPATTLALGAVALLAFLQPAHAYLDPGTGSILLQALIGGIAAGLFLIKTKWAELKARFADRGPQNQDPRG